MVWLYVLYIGLVTTIYSAHLMELKVDDAQFQVGRNLNSRLRQRRSSSNECELLRQRKARMTIGMVSSWAKNCSTEISNNCGEVEVWFQYDKFYFSKAEFIVFLYTTSKMNCSFMEKPLYKLNTTDPWACKQPGNCCADDNCLVLFRNKPPGDYCAKVSYSHCWTESTPDYISDRSYVVEPPSPAKAVKVLSSSTDQLHYILLGTFLSLTSVAVLIFAVVRKWCKSDIPPPLQCEQKSTLIEEIRASLPVKVFLLYFPDCIHHVDVVHQLASFLRCCHCEISYDLLEKPEIAENVVSWIAKKLQGNYRILLINSRMAYIMQKRYIQNKKAFKVGDLTSDVFISAIAQIMHDPEKLFDYKKIHMIRPSYVMKEHILQDICPGRSYEIPKELPVLLCNLLNLNYQCTESDESQLDIGFPALYSQLSYLIKKLEKLGCTCCDRII